MRNILAFMLEAVGKSPMLAPTPLITDNDGMWKQAHNVGVSARTMYWRIWMHFVRDEQSNRTIDVLKTDTHSEIADIFKN